jgi:hypothetical protein
MFTKEFNRRRMARRQQGQRQQGRGGGQQGGYSYEEFRREFKNAGRDPSAYLRKMEMVPADASEEEIRSMVEEGKIPFFNPATGEPPEYEPINLDLSGQKNAIRELADAKIQAAKKGVATGEENVRAANARLLANAFGPGLFQALTGTQQPTNQTTNYARSARKAGRELRNAEQRAARVEATANARADQQIASMEAEEALRLAQDKRKMKQLNAELERNRQNAVAEARQGMVSRALNMSQRDAQIARQRAKAKLDYAQEVRESQSQQGNPAAKAIRVTTNQIAAIESQEQKLRRLNNRLVNGNFDPENGLSEDEIKQEISKVIARSGGLGGGFSNRSITEKVSKKLEDMQSQKDLLTRQIPQTVEQSNGGRAVMREYNRYVRTVGSAGGQQGRASEIRSPEELEQDTNSNPQDRATNSGDTTEPDPSQDDGVSEKTGAFIDSTFSPTQ